MKIINASSVQQVPVSELSEHPENPNRGNVSAIRESITENGFFGAVLAQKSTGYILAGNHSFRAACQSGADKIPVIWVDVDEDRAKKIMLADNRMAEKAFRDEEQLAALLEDLNKRDRGLLGTGYDAGDLDALLTSLSPPDLEMPGLDFDVENPFLKLDKEKASVVIYEIVGPVEVAEELRKAVLKISKTFPNVHARKK